MEKSEKNYPTFEFTVPGFEKLRAFGNEINNIEEKINFYNYQIQRYDEQNSPYAGPAGIDFILLLSLERDYWDYITKIREHIKVPKPENGDSFSDQSWAHEFFNTCVIKIYFQKWELFDYDLDRIKEHTKEIGSIENQIFYLRFIFKEFKIQSALYPNIYTKQRTGYFESKLLKRIKELRNELENKIPDRSADTKINYTEIITNAIKKEIDKLLISQNEIKEIVKGQSENKKDDTKVKSPKSTKPYNDEMLAKYFVNFIIEKKNAVPSQLELADYSKIAQATWNRRLKKESFQKLIQKELSLIVKETDIAHEIVVKAIQKNNDDLEKIRLRNKKSKEVSSEKVGSSILQSEGNLDMIDNKIDIENELKKLNKEKLIQRLMELDPDYKKSELEKYDEENLVQIILSSIE